VTKEVGVITIVHPVHRIEHLRGFSESQRFCKTTETVETAACEARGRWLVMSAIGKMGCVSCWCGLPGQQLEVVSRGGHGELFHDSGETPQLERSHAYLALKLTSAHNQPILYSDKCYSRNKAYGTKLCPITVILGRKGSAPKASVAHTLIWSLHTPSSQRRSIWTSRWCQPRSLR